MGHSNWEKGRKRCPSLLRLIRQTTEQGEMEAVYIQLSRYLLPTLIIFGTVGALINLILFYRRKPLRANSCALYFRALSFNDLLVLWIVVFPQWLRDQFDLELTTQYAWCCKLYTYFTYTLYTISPYYVVLACFDRLCTSSTHAKLRRIATLYIAYRLIFAVVLIISVLQLYIWVGADVISTPYGSFCAISKPILNRILTFSVVLVFCFIPPLLMMIFCTITLVLLRQQQHRVMPVNQRRIRHRDRQLLKMLFIYVTCNIICIVPFTIAYFIAIYVHNNPSPLTNSLVQIFTILVNVAYATSFYIYTLGTPFYRDELVALVKHIIRQTQNRLDHLPLATLHTNDIWASRPVCVGLFVNTRVEIKISTQIKWEETMDVFRTLAQLRLWGLFAIVCTWAVAWPCRSNRKSSRGYSSSEITTGLIRTNFDRLGLTLTMKIKTKMDRSSVGMPKPSDNPRMTPRFLPRSEAIRSQNFVTIVKIPSTVALSVVFLVRKVAVVDDREVNVAFLEVVDAFLLDIVVREGNVVLLALVGCTLLEARSMVFKIIWGSVEFVAELTVLDSIRWSAMVELAYLKHFFVLLLSGEGWQITHR